MMMMMMMMMDLRSWFWVLGFRFCVLRFVLWALGLSLGVWGLGFGVVGNTTCSFLEHDQLGGEVGALGRFTELKQQLQRILCFTIAEEASIRAATRVRCSLLCKMRACGGGGGGGGGGSSKLFTKSKKVSKSFFHPIVSFPQLLSPIKRYTFAHFRVTS